MTHEEIKILISAYIDGEVTPSEKNIAEEHLSSCPECQKDYKAYRAMSSSLSQWSNESLSPDEEINVQRKFEQRREPMFTKHSVTALTTTLVLTVLVGSVVIPNMKRSVQGRMKSASDDIGDQFRQRKFYTENYHVKPNIPQSQAVRASAPVKEYWDQGLASAKSDSYYNNKRLAEGTLAYNGLQKEMVGSSQGFSTNLSRGMMASAKVSGGSETSEYYQSANAPFAINEEERKKIQRADLTLRVENAFKTKAQLTDIITQINGIIESSTFNRSPEGSGQGTMVCKVYPKDLEPALQQMRKLGEVQTESQGSMDVTDRYADAQKNMVKYQSDKERLEKSLKNFKLFNPTTDAEKESIKQQIAQTEESLKALERVIHFYQEQTTMSLVTVNYYDNFKSASKENEGASQWRVRLGDKWKATIDASTDVFTNMMFGTILVFSYIAPVLVWGVLFLVIYAIVRMFIKKQ